MASLDDVQHLRDLEARVRVPASADLVRMLYWRLATRFISASMRVVDLDARDGKMLEALRLYGRRPREYVGVGLDEKGAPSWARRPRAGDKDFDLVIALGGRPVRDLKTARLLGAPGAHYLFHGPKWSDLWKAGFDVERAIWLDLPPDIAREVLAPPVVRAYTTVSKLYGEDVARALFAPLMSAEEGGDQDRIVYVLRDAKRSEKPKPDLVEKPSVAAIYKRGAEAAAAAAAKRRAERERDPKVQGDRRHRDHDVVPVRRRRADDADHRVRAGRKPRGGIGAFIRERILAKEAPDKTLAEVHRRWPESTAKMSDWHWNRRKLAKEGLLR